MAELDTPTTEEVRERFVDGFPMDTWMVARQEAVADFDRWLRARDAQKWAEGYAAGQDSIYTSVHEWPNPDITNPYIPKENADG